MEEVEFPSGGDPVRGTLHTPDGDAKGTLVLVHGFLSQRIEFADAGERLAEHGWNALLFDQRGFGKSGGDPGVVAVDRAVEDVQSAIGFLKRRNLADRVGLVGHSMGTVFASAAAFSIPEVKGLVQVAPLRSIPSELGTLEYRAYQLAGTVSRLKNRLGLGHLVIPYKTTYADLFVDEAAAARAKQLAFLEDRVSLGNYDELVAMDGEVHARRVTAPTLVVICERDKVVTPENSLAVYEAYAGPKELLRLPCGHSAFGDCESKRLIGAIDRFMAAHVA